MSLDRRVSHVRRLFVVAALLGLLATIVGISPVARPALVGASHTTNPTSVTIAGSLQQELGCPGDWQPACASTHLAYDSDDDVWQGEFAVPGGSWEYKAALNDAWIENYGAGAVFDGPNIAFNLGAPTSVKFYYDHKTHWITSNQNAVIATAAGSFQSELGCPGDWQPECLRSMLQDPDGDGTYRFVTTDIPAGSYEFKAALNEGWAESYGQGGGPDNIPFTVPSNGSEVTFSYDAATHVPTVSVVAAGSSHDNNVEWDGLRHDSRDLLYRTPGGAVPAGTPVTIRFRTFHDDVTSVKLRVYDLNANGQSLTTMALAAAGVSCYQAGLEDDTCDFWAATLPNATPNNLWYRFVVTDGTDTDYYADNTPALDGGVGATSDEVIDNSYALMVHYPDFTSPAWAKSAVIYQIFPDRFRDGRKDNNPKTNDVRYDDPVIKLPWGTLPEGYCRNYADGDVHCPWRFDTTPPDYSPTIESPRGRDYMGGDLKGVDQKLDYLASLGITAIYFNPIFDAGSNHSYDTQDYTRVDPYFGTQKDWANLVKHADALGIRIMLDGVFNHLSSDSAFFDRYHHYPAVGACESQASPYRSWFTFHDVTPGTGTCVSSTGVANAATYDGWFGFDSIPVLNKSNAQVQAYFLTNPDSITARWLAAGASAWRMDVSGDASFPNGYWETFRDEVDDADPDALTISETWQKDSTLLRMLRGDRLDTTMNYRLRDAVIGLLAPGSFDSKGFADSGDGLNPSEFAARLASVREDYPDAAYYALMNLLDSHDTERLLWTLTPGTETTADKELNAGNLAEGKLRLRLASLLQYGVPGAPTVYYGDEVGVTGDDDPDDRRTYPWADLGGSPDNALFAHYQTLAAVRAANPALTDGDFRILFADDASGTVGFGRKMGSQAAIVVVNSSDAPSSGDIPVGGFVPDGTEFTVAYGVGVPSGGSFTVVGGALAGSLPAFGGAILVTGTVDLAPPSPPTGLTADEGNATV
ncbi:MAG TPA: alpha-amylase family glycosyl hydrolase, partial [Ilumatobacteraceae bacterium]|nr:alpha-amylase family glycosyl hydrolase [Ilumatobacteraceae bacterium]